MEAVAPPSLLRPGGGGTIGNERPPRRSGRLSTASTEVLTSAQTVSAAAAWQDAVGRTAARLPHRRFPPRCLASARESHRLLQARVPVPLLGRGDCHEARAAVLLRRSCLLHKEPSLEWKDFASAVGQKPAALEGLASRIAHYLQPAEAAEATMEKARPGKRSADAPPGDSFEDDTRLWAELSVRLPSSPPPDAVRRARDLWCRLNRHVASLPRASDRRGYLHDLRRNGPAYRAACLYHTLVPQTRTAAGGGHRGVGRGGGGACLKLDDFLLPDFTLSELKQVWKQVEQFAHDIDQAAEANGSDTGVGTCGGPPQSAAFRTAVQASSRRTALTVCRSSDPPLSTEDRRRRHSRDGVSVEPTLPPAAVASTPPLSPRRDFAERQAALWQALGVDPDDPKAVAAAADAVLVRCGLLPPKPTLQPTDSE